MADSGSCAERNVVVAMDGSDHSGFAFDWYMDNVHRKTDHVVLVHVPEYQAVMASPMVMADASIFTEQLQAAKEKEGKFMEVLGDKLRSKNVGGKVKSVHGIPGEVICQVASDVKANLIITGTRGNGTLRRTFLGSVSDYVLHHAHVPVIVCRHKDHHHKH